MSSLTQAFWIAITASILVLSSASTASSAPPSPEDDKKVSGTWVVHSNIGARLYHINENRNLKIVGGGRKEKTGKLRPQEDGSYIADADGAILRLIHNKDKDTLTVENYPTKKDIERKLPPAWKANCKREAVDKK